MPTVTIIKPTITTTMPLDIPPKRRVAGYARVSTDKDEQFTSYEAQVEYYTRYICSRPDWEFVKVYTDEGITATSIKRRNGFKQMVKDALDGKIDLIITKSISRFARNTVDSLQTIRKLKEHKVELYFEKENIWTFDGKGELLITIMSSLAQEESRSISENVTWGMRESMRQGNAWVPYSVFLGYDKGVDENWVIVPEQAALVRRIYGMYLQGMSPYHIGKTLEKEGIEFSKGKKKWYSTTVASILRNEKYKGDALRQKTYTADYLTKEKVKNEGELQQYYIHDHHEAIISPELFDRVQLEIRRRGNAEEKRGGKRLFSTRVKCGDCGGWYGPCTWAFGKAKERTIWRCNHKYSKGKKNCTSPALGEDELKNVFINAVNKLLKDKGKIINTFENIKSKLFNTEGFKAEKLELENEIKTVNTMVQTATIEQAENLEKRANIADRRIAELDRLIEDIRLQEVEMEAFIRSIACQKKMTKFEDELFVNLLDYMTVHNNGTITVTFKDGTTIKG